IPACSRTAAHTSCCSPTRPRKANNELSHCVLWRLRKGPLFCLEDKWREAEAGGRKTLLYLAGYRWSSGSVGVNTDGLCVNGEMPTVGGGDAVVARNFERLGSGSAEVMECAGKRAAPQSPV